MLIIGSRFALSNDLIVVELSTKFTGPFRGPRAHKGNLSLCPHVATRPFLYVAIISGERACPRTTKHVAVNSVTVMFN